MKIKIKHRLRPFQLSLAYDYSSDERNLIAGLPYQAEIVYQNGDQFFKIELLKELKTKFVEPILTSFKIRLTHTGSRVAFCDGISQRRLEMLIEQWVQFHNAVTEAVKKNNLQWYEHYWFSLLAHG